MSTKIDTWIACKFDYRSRSSGFGTFVPGTFARYNRTELFSESHPGPYDSISGNGDKGGPFYLEKDISTFKLRGPLLGSLYQGYIAAGQSTSFVETPTPSEPTEAAMNASGATAIARTLPTNPTFAAATALGELREQMPHIIGSSFLKDQSKFLKNSGDEYLNVEFGWKPMMSDLRNLARAVKQHKKIIDAYRRGSGTKIRRRYVFPEVSTTRNQSSGGILFPTQANASAIARIQETVSSKTWFSGAFRYYLPLGDTTSEKLERWESEANKLLGTRLTPSVVWELAPWSWAVDWFSNVGDVMTNISAFGHDGLVLQYGYVMTHLQKKMYLEQTSGGEIVSRYTVNDRKKRLPATPYGFGVTIASLTARQGAIIAALGLSKNGFKAI